MTDPLDPAVVIRSGVPAPALVPLSRGETVLGRQSDANLVLPSPFVSRRHARIDFDGRECRIRDLGSTNGTFVNGQRVGEAPLELADGDVIQLGRNAVALEFQATVRTPTVGAAHERRATPGAAVVVDDATREVRVRGEILDPPLSRKEFDVLEFLYRNADRACSIAEIAAAGWPERPPGEVEDAEVRQYIRRIRRRIEYDPPRPDYLRTIHGYGYRLGA